MREVRFLEIRSPGATRRISPDEIGDIPLTATQKISNIGCQDPNSTLARTKNEIETQIKNERLKTQANYRRVIPPPRQVAIKASSHKPAQRAGHMPAHAVAERGGPLADPIRVDSKMTLPIEAICLRESLPNFQAPEHPFFGDLIDVTRRYKDRRPTQPEVSARPARKSGA